MKAKAKKIVAYAAVVVVLGSLGLYASMEDYQKQNMAKLVSQTFSQIQN